MRKKIIVFAGGWGGEFLQESLAGIAEAAMHFNIDVISFVNFSVHNDNPDVNTADINFFKLPDIGCFDGAIILANSFNDSRELDYITSEIKRTSIPTISVEYEIPGISTITTDNFSGMYDLVKHVLCEHHVKNPVFIGGPEIHPECQERLSAFRQACLEENVVLGDGSVLFGDWSKLTIPPLINKWLESNKLPDAFICANDIMAMATCDYLRDMDVKIPEDIIVTGFDCINEAQFYNPPVTSVNHEWHEMGLLAFKQLHKVMMGVAIDSKTELKTRFVPAGTCGCEPSSLHNSANKEYLERVLTDHQMDPLLIDSHFRHFYNAVRKAADKETLHNNFAYLFTNSHIIEGDSFELYIDPEFFNIVEGDTNLHVNGHPEYYDRICAVSGNTSLPIASIKKEDTVFSATNRSEKAGYYVMIPLYSEKYTLGFAVLNGALNAANENQYYIWTRHMIQALEQVRSNITISKLYEQMRILSETDPLTGVYNRSGCQSTSYPRMIEHSRNGNTSVLMLVDVDRMKVINDQYGHAAGDKALIAVTNVLRFALPDSYNICRFGGDEFLITGCLSDKDEDLDSLISDIENKLASYVKDNKIAFPLTISIGYSKFMPNDVSDIEKAIIVSDNNMYQKKKLHHQDS